MSVWTEERVVITGGTGFVGRRLSEALVTRGARVHAIGRAAYDLRNAADAARMFRDLEPTMVVHLAAVVGGIGANRARPAEFFLDNLLMGAHVLDHAWRARVRKAVLVGTVCAYPKFTAVPFREDDLWNGYPEETNAAYGLAKRALLVQAQAYRQQYGYNAIYLLPTNLYGPGDNFDLHTSHVIPALIRKCLDAAGAGHDVVQGWGDGSATRDFLYVDDAVEGILLAAERYDSGDPVNLGSAEEVSIADLATQIANLTGFNGTIAWDRSQPNGQPRRCLDVTRAARFGFRPRTSLEAGLRRTIDWYRNEVSSSIAGAVISEPR
jgi:GDP-L-fucose synthase